MDKRLLELNLKTTMSSPRYFIIILLFVIGSFDLLAQIDVQPNIIYLFTDQQNASMMSCTGNENLRTPAMDYIAEH